MELEIRLLGSLAVLVDGRCVDMGGRRTQRLLAALALNPNRAVSLNRLIELLWDRPPHTANQQIYTVIAALRRHLDGVAGISTSAAGYRMDVTSDAVDVHRFQTSVERAQTLAAQGAREAAIEQLTRAGQLWYGPALAGLDGAYFASVATRLEEERLNAVDLLAALRIEQGEGVQVIGELTSVVSAQPLRESSRAWLMRALYGAGRQADALDVYAQGRRILADELGLDPGFELQSLHEGILTGRLAPDTRLESTAEAAAPTGTARPAGKPGPDHNRYLPHTSREFTGRVRELERLASASAADDPVAIVITAVSGMGGVGKTALAIQFAQTMAAKAPDGQFYVDLRGFTPDAEPLSPADALGALLRQSGLADELLPGGLEDRASVWRDRMAGKRAIVVLDNAMDAQQVRPLIPGTSGPVVVITSRRRLPTLEGAVALPLDVLSAEEGVALFKRLVGPERTSGNEEATAKVVELCGRLPLAIRIAAARFRDRESWDVRYLAELLADARRRRKLLDIGDRSVSAVLGVSHRYLAAEHQRVFRLLSVHPGKDVTAQATAALAEIRVDQAEGVLESLYDDNLLLQESPGRYQLHDLVRDCAKKLAEQHDSAAALHEAGLRLVDYYLECAAKWCAPLAVGPFSFRPGVQHRPSAVPTPNDAEQAVALLRRESENLSLVARFAFGLDSPRRAWQVVCVLQPYLRHTNYGGRALELFEAAVDAARADDDNFGRVLSLMGLAAVLRSRRRLDEAAAVLRESLAGGAAAGDSLRATALTELGVTLEMDARLSEAYACFTEALELARRSEDRPLQTMLKNNLAAVCRQLGRYEESLSLLRSVLEAPEAGTPGARAYPTVNVGLLLLRTGAFAEAAAILERALDSATEARLTRVRATALAGLCVTDRVLGDVSHALTRGRTALAFAREHGLLEAECAALNALGETHLALGALSEAAAVFTNSLELARGRSLREASARALEGRAHVALHAERTDEARTLFEEAVVSYPHDVAEVAEARQHLAALGDRSIRCLRCRVGRQSALSTPQTTAASGSAAD